MFNDTFLALYVMICIYFIASNKPLWASFFLTLSLSVKAGAMLLVPSFMGWIHAHYGTKNLLMSFFVIAAF